MGLFWGLQFDYNDQSACFYASTMWIFLLLLLQIEELLIFLCGVSIVVNVASHNKFGSVPSVFIL